MQQRLVSLLLLLTFATTTTSGGSRPGRPVLLGCRSPDKETFTCWWEPGSDGGLPTTHRLFYRTEQSKRTLECPDYRSAGSNACFFDRSRTSIWVDYFLTVVATNALGNATSNTLKIDVMEIVKPNPPENISVQVLRRDEHEHLSITWLQPRNTDTGSGWVTFKYEVRVKDERSDEWKIYTSGTETTFNLYTVSPGVSYQIQVRCRLDHSSWSEWSNAVSIRTSSYHLREKAFWILVLSLSTVPILTALCVLVIKRRNVKKCLLPPVPGPKIKGIDVQLLKKGLTDDIAIALIVNHSFPPVVSWKDENKDLLIISDDDSPTDNPTFPKRKNSLLVPGGFQVTMDVSSEIERKDTPYLFENRQLCQPVTSYNIYVDDMSKRQDNPLPEDYSRVKDVVGDNCVLLQRQLAVPVSYTECNNKKPHSPQYHATNGEDCPEMMGSGYVESVPSLLTM